MTWPGRFRRPGQVDSCDPPISKGVVKEGESCGEGQRALRGNLHVILLFLAPTLLFYTAFLILPVFDSLRLSLYSGKLLRIDRFVGLANFHRLFFVPPFNTAFFNAFRNTIELFVILAAIQNTIPLVFAVIISRVRFAPFFRVVFFIPSLVPLIVVGFLFKMILNPVRGVLDKALRFIHLGLLVRPWPGDAHLAIPVIAPIWGLGLLRPAVCPVPRGNQQRRPRNDRSGAD